MSLKAKPSWFGCCHWCRKSAGCGRDC